MKRQVILGIDPGTIVTGYGVIQITGREIKPLDFGEIKPPAKMELQFRYRYIFEALQELMGLHAPCEIAVEMQFVDKNASSTLKLGMAKGIVLLTASLHEIPLFEYPPSVVKRAVTGRGNANKDQVGKMITKLLTLPSQPPSEDASDALAIALCHSYKKKYV